MKHLFLAAALLAVPLSTYEIAMPHPATAAESVVAQRRAQAPGLYQFRLGDFQITTLSDGTVPQDLYKLTVDDLLPLEGFQQRSAEKVIASIEASKQRNVIPAVCDVTVDCRLLPGDGTADVEPLLRATLAAAGIGDDKFEIHWIEKTGGTRSPLDTPLWHAIEGFIDEIEPGARLAPICSSGFTDSHWLREAFGTVAYGFFPMRTMDFDLAARLVHSANERIPVDDLELGFERLRYVAKALA